MLILAANSLPQVDTMREVCGPNVGRLVTPRNTSYLDEMAASGMAWGVDNDAFSAWDERRFTHLVKRLRDTDLAECRFVAVPDVVADADSTLERFAEWQPRLDGLPLALVGQDGLTIDAVPWDALDAFFIGGSTEWKLSIDAVRLVIEAKRRGLHVHMGRVNSIRRAAYAASIGCDSIDGTKFGRWWKSHLETLAIIASASRQLSLLTA